MPPPPSFQRLLYLPHLSKHIKGLCYPPRKVEKDSLSAPNAQKSYSFTAQSLEPLVITQGPLNISMPSKQNVHYLPSTLGDFPLQRTLEMSSQAQGTLEPLVSAQGEGTKNKSEKDNLRQSVSLHGTVVPSLHKTGALGSSRHVHRKAQILPFKEEAEKHSLSPKAATGLPKSETRTSENLPPRSSSTQKTKKHYLPKGS